MSIEHIDITIDAFTADTHRARAVLALQVDIKETKVSNTCTRLHGVKSHDIFITSGFVYIMYRNTQVNVKGKVIPL